MKCPRCTSWTPPAGKVAGVFDRRAVERGDDIAGLDASLCSWTSVLRLVDHCTFDFLHAEAVGDARGYRLNLDAEPYARHNSFVLELGNNCLRCPRRDIKANADRTARGRVNRGIDAYDVAIDVECETAGIALVDRRIDLNVVVVWAGVDVAPLAAAPAPARSGCVATSRLRGGSGRARVRRAHTLRHENGPSSLASSCSPICCLRVACFECASGPFRPVPRR
jgi:hypothetical protein